MSSELRVYNTLTRKLDKFETIRANRVNMFVCGPTVWDVSHIGHGKTYVAYDIIARYLRRKGFSLFLLLNITDVDDKIINKAHDIGEQPLALADRLARAFFKDMKELHVDSVNLYAKASDHIPEILDQITGLLKKGIAYRCLVEEPEAWRDILGESLGKGTAWLAHRGHCDYSNVLWPNV